MLNNHHLWTLSFNISALNATQTQQLVSTHPNETNFLKKRQRRPSQVEFEKRKESGNFSERLLMMVNDD